MAIINRNNKKFDIIVLAGQSNAESSGVGSIDNEWQINERIKMLKGDYIATVQKPNTATIIYRWICRTIII